LYFLSLDLRMEGFIFYYYNFLERSELGTILNIPWSATYRPKIPRESLSPGTSGRMQPPRQTLSNPSHLVCKKNIKSSDALVQRSHCQASYTYRFFRGFRDPISTRSKGIVLVASRGQFGRIPTFLGLGLGWQHKAYNPAEPSN
jgi:hypothetical protein